MFSVNTEHQAQQAQVTFGQYGCVQGVYLYKWTEFPTGDVGALGMVTRTLRDWWATNYGHEPDAPIVYPPRRRRRP